MRTKIDAIYRQLFIFFFDEFANVWMWIDAIKNKNKNHSIRERIKRTEKKKKYNQFSIPLDVIAVKGQNESIEETKPIDRKLHTWQCTVFKSSSKYHHHHHHHQQNTKLNKMFSSFLPLFLPSSRTKFIWIELLRSHFFFWNFYSMLSAC